MLGYYPLEHLSYLVSHGIIPETVQTPSLPAFLSFIPFPKSIKLNTGKLSLWSCRFWLMYILLQFAHLREDRKLLLQRQKLLRKSKAGTLKLAEELELGNRWDAWWNEIAVNLGNLPLALHW
jgi:hypothetical protein